MLREHRRAVLGATGPIGEHWTVAALPDEALAELGSAYR
jgi:hypothetical protein